MVELFRKYLENQCSPAEVNSLFAYFESAENESQLRQLITESLETVASEDDGTQWASVTGESFDVIKKQLKGKSGRVTSMLRGPWFRVAAAAVILLGTYMAYTLLNKTSPEKDIVKTETSTHDPGPGTDKGVLTLADGSTIILEKMENGTITRQGDITIIKKDGGQLVYTSLNEKPTEVLFNNITTPRGGQFKVTLGEGSKVWLNAASSLSFPAAFEGDERRVKLEGEAYFEVATHASPFKIEVAGQGEVEVMGTRFNINAYTDEKAVKTTLLEGRVKIRGRNTNDTQILQPGEQAHLNNKGQISISKDADTEQSVAWKNGIFNFNNADLDIVLRQLSRWYDVDIVVEGAIPKKQFHGEIQRNLKLMQVLKLLEKNNVSTRLEGNTLIVLIL
jgi:ferric-dicitrate binding protein FerR (iron transport regulator)